MVVAPRYMPRRGVPDAARIAPSVTPEGTRAGHDISVDVRLDAGVPIQSVESRTHDVSIDRPNPRQAVVKLRDKAVIPNKDFILTYGVAGRRIEDAVLTHTGYFTLLLQPPDRVQPEEIAPKELVFVLDTSGSMSGFPIEKAKESMALALDGLHPRDTFNLITFAGDTHILFPNPVCAANRVAASSPALKIIPFSGDRRRRATAGRSAGGDAGGHEYEGVSQRKPRVAQGIPIP